MRLAHAARLLRGFRLGLRRVWRQVAKCELGRKGGRATPKAKPANVQRETLREFLRREVDPARVWAAIEAGLESGNDRDRLAASKLLLTELYEPAAERPREEEAEGTGARARLALCIEQMSAKRTCLASSSAG